jgi:hypothetical protein
MRRLGARKRPSDYKYYRPPRRTLFPLNLRRRLVLPNFLLVSTFSLSVIRLIGRHNGPLRSFRSRGPFYLDTRCWPVHGRTYTDRSEWCPDTPSNSAGLRALPVHRLSAQFFFSDNLNAFLY